MDLLEHLLSSPTEAGCQKPCRYLNSNCWIGSFPSPSTATSPGQAKQTPFLTAATAIASYMVSLLQILPPISPFFTQLSDSSFNKQNQRYDTTWFLCLRIFTGLPFSVTWRDSSRMMLHGTTLTLQILKVSKTWKDNKLSGQIRRKVETQRDKQRMGATFSRRRLAIIGELCNAHYYLRMIFKMTSQNQA